MPGTVDEVVDGEKPAPGSTISEPARVTPELAPGPAPELAWAALCD
ncbi:MAG: hypothetical protein ACRDOB_16720 [Streptosporangiaceae bacterium]